MAAGPNYVLDKGFLADGSSAYKYGEVCVLTDATHADRATSANAANVIGVCQEDIDAAKVTTDKVYVDVRILGISRVIIGSAVAVGDHLTNDTSARAVKKTQATEAQVPGPVFAIALSAATNAGEQVECLLTPGLVY